ncbi:MAG: hypothetical protein GX801_10875 [Fibrobacter sp.]|nr:hypothetical protein [Fibrobacter sp.]
MLQLAKIFTFSFILFASTAYSQAACATFITWVGSEDAKILEKQLAKSQPRNSLDSLKEAVQWVDLANIKPDIKVARKALAKMEAISDKSLSPEWQLMYKSYLGVSRSIVGRDATNPVEKIQKVNEAVSLLDETVQVGGDDCVLLIFLRAMVMVSLPDFFKKQGVAQQDFNTVLQRSPAKELQCASHFYLGNIYKDLGQIGPAMSHWQKAQAFKKGKCAMESQKMLTVFMD